MFKQKKINDSIDVKIDTSTWALPLYIDMWYNFSRNVNELHIYVMCFAVRFQFNK